MANVDVLVGTSVRHARSLDCVLEMRTHFLRQVRVPGFPVSTIAIRECIHVSLHEDSKLASILFLEFRFLCIFSF